MSTDRYPPSPTAVPPGLTAAPPAYRRNVWLAVVGVIGFVLVYSALTGWFAYKAVTLIRDAWQGGPRAFLGFATGGVAAFLAVFLGKAIFFVRHHADPSLTEITAADQPELFGFLRRLASETGARMPNRVYLSPRVNAAVFYDLSILNLLIPSRKNLEIGVGLVNALTLAEFKAVLAHELGHFAQRSMAVGRWVYIAQQVAGHIVAKRDGFDRFLQGLSNIDLRIAWIGWGLRLIVWSIRSVMDSLFGVIILAERALSREMELQADLVSVLVSGSDALVHALRKLPAADSAWDSAVDIFTGELNQGRLGPDLCAMQARILECHRRVLDDPLHGSPPPLPDTARDRHRVFAVGLSQPPQMWSTHPPSHVREDNAKRRYVPAELDDRPAWVIFSDADAVRRTTAERVADLVGRPEQLAPSDLATSLAAVDRRFDKRYLDRRYRGVYLGRRITRSADRPAELCAPGPSEPPAPHEALRSLYPESLSETVTRARALASEVSQLEAIRNGMAKAPGGVIRYGGEEFHRRELGEVLARAKQDQERTLSALREHDRRSRSAHRDAATVLGRGWPAYLESLRTLLFYAEHTEANIDDAAGHLRNVVAVVTADGRVSSGERQRVVQSGIDLQHNLEVVFDHRAKVKLPAAVAAKLGVESWQAVLPTTFELYAPTEETLSSFMTFVDSWFGAFSEPLGALRGATLEALLETEAQLARALLEEQDPGDAPEPARVPLHYAVLRDGQERPRQTTLGLWDRFMVADGLGPALARLTVAGAIVGTVVGLGGAVGSPTLVVHNGLGRPVIVSVGDDSITVPGHGRRELNFDPGPQVNVRAETTEHREIEAFVADGGNAMADYVYNIGGGSPMYDAVVTYGAVSAREPTSLGAPRWFATQADYILVEPPESISTDRRGTTRTLLWSPPATTPLASLAPLDAAESERVALFHARWESTEGNDAQWLVLAASSPQFAEVLQARLADGDPSVLLGRFEQDLSEGDEHRAVCSRHQASAQAQPEDVDRAYLAARCIEDAALRDARFLELRQHHPDHEWLAQAAAYAHFERDEFAASIAALDVAIRELPAMNEQNAISSARIRRRAAPGDSPDLAPLAEQSLLLRLILSLETGERLGDEPPVTAYRHLGAGDLGAAVQQSPERERARVLRLVAASEGADPSWVAAARELQPDDGIDTSTLWTALAFATAQGLNAAPYIERLQRDIRGQAEVMLGFIDRQQLLADPARANTAMHTLPPELRGQAAVMGLITLGKDAPAEWRIEARTLLFASERPFFRAPEDVPVVPVRVVEEPVPEARPRHKPRR